MARPIYPYELGDPDFSWLINSFLENNPQYAAVESGCLPVVFLKDLKPLAEGEFQEPEIPRELLPPSDEALLDDHEY